MPKCYVFTGPTIAASAVQALSPGSITCPPVASRDLLRLRPASGDVIVLIDGFFRQTAAVRHKEILACLEKGVRVVGASSMGALRAAELAPFGMAGFGEVYRQYVAGEIDGDDEVALLHLPAAEGYRPTTEALVNLRHNLARAADSHVISPAVRDGLVRLAKALPFSERTIPRVLKLGSTAGLPGAEIDALRMFLQEQYVDLKREDAVALLQHLQRETLTWELAPTPTLHRTQCLVEWQREATGRGIGEDLFASDSDVLRTCQVGCLGYPAFHRQVSIEAMAALFAAERRLEPPANAALMAAFRSERSLREDSDFSAWLEEHYLRADELVEQLRVTALAQEAARLLAPRYVNPPDRLGWLAVESLIHGGFLETHDHFPTELEAWISENERERLGLHQRLVQAAVRAFRLPAMTRWEEPYIAAIKLGGFFGVALSRFHQMVLLDRRFQSDQPGIDMESLDREAIVAWYSHRWGSAEPFDLQLLDRGLNWKDFALFAGRYLLYDRSHPGDMQVGPFTVAANCERRPRTVKGADGV